MRRILIFSIALFCAGQLHAQQTQQSLDAEINQLLPSNGRNEITATNVRQVLTDMVTAIFTAQSSWSVGGANPLAVPTQNAPIAATLAVGGAYADSSAGNIFQISSYLTQAGARPAVAIFGQSQATGSGSLVWGANFVAYANVNGSFAQGVEVDVGTASGTTTATAYGISVNAGGVSGSNSVLGLQFSSLGAGATFTNAIAFLINGSVQPFTNALLATGGALTPNYGINFTSASFQVAAIATPGFTVDPNGDVLILRTGTPGYTTIGRADNPGAGNQVGAVNMPANNSASAQINFAQINAWADTVTAGSEAGHLCVAAELSSSLGNALCVGTGVSIGSYAASYIAAPAGGIIVSGNAFFGASSAVNNVTFSYSNATHAIANMINTHATAGDGGFIVSVGPTGTSDTTSYFMDFLNASLTTVYGSVTRNGSGTAYGTSSDRRLKHRVRAAAAGLETLWRLAVVDWDHSDDPADGGSTGFVAQDVAALYPAAALPGEDDGHGTLQEGKRPWMMDYGRMTPLVAHAVQQLAAIVAMLALLVLALAAYIVVRDRRAIGHGIFFLAVRGPMRLAHAAYRLLSAEWENSR